MKKKEQLILIKVDNEYINPKNIISIKLFNDGDIRIYLNDDKYVDANNILIEDLLKHIDAKVIDITGE